MVPTPAARIASSSVSVPTVLLWKYFDGFVIDSPTSALAAKCTTASIRWRANTSRRRSASTSVPRSSGPHLTAHSWPCVRSSKTIGW